MSTALRLASRRTALSRAIESLEERRLFASLGLVLESPLISVDSDPETANTVSYNPATNLLDFHASASTVLTLDPLSFTPINPIADVHIQLKVDTSGNLIGGVDGVDDLLISHDHDNDPTTPDAVLLKGEIVPGAFAADSAGGYLEAIFSSLSGSLASQFSGTSTTKVAGLSVSLTPAPFSFAAGFAGLVAKGYIGALPPLPDSPQPSTLSGYVYSDCENDGIRQANNVGIAGASVSLYNSAGQLVQTIATDANGKYTFANLPAGKYTVVENPGGVLAAYLDGKDTVGTGTATPGANPANDKFTVTLVGGENAIEYNFGEIKPASINGFVWLDLNDDATIDFGEDGIKSVTVTLYKQVGNSWVKVATDVTDSSGFYQFENLLPGNYKVVESQPCGLDDGKDALGTVDGSPVGSVTNDVFCNVKLDCGDHAINYNFGERPPAGCTVRCGQTATIGFWQNKNGQALLRALNGGATATDLGNWLAGAFPNLYGNSAVNFAGKSNDYIAKYFVSNMFNVKSQQKVDAQVLAVAFAVYVTSKDLAGTTASKYGFNVSTYGVGASTFNVGSNGAAFGVANKTTMRVIDLLIATDRRSWNGKLYDANRNGITESQEQTYRNMANTVFSAINEQGDI